jgi:MoxR-like ATPase
LIAVTPAYTAAPGDTVAIDAAARILANVERVVVGKHDEIALVLAALISGGHVLLEDVPGTAKTILARAIAQSLDGTTFARIQCTPDLQPTDITGLSIFNQRTRDFEFRPSLELAPRPAPAWDR